MTASREQRVKDLKDGPFFVVNTSIPVHTGPFEVYMDACLCAQLVASHSDKPGIWVVYNYAIFNDYLSGKLKRD